MAIKIYDIKPPKTIKKTEMTELKDVLHLYYGHEVQYLGTDRTWLKNGDSITLHAESIRAILDSIENYKLIEN